MIDKKRIIKKGIQIGVDVEPIAEVLDLYAQLLVDYNTKVNLTGIVDPVDIEDKHFIDCLFLAKQNFVYGNVCDVGSGAGFPGIIIKLLCPDIELTLIEPTEKRCVFLRFLIEKLRISAEVVPQRAEVASKNLLYRERYNLVAARAVAPLPMLLEYLLPFCAVLGTAVAMKGGAESIETGYKTATILGADDGTKIDYLLPKGDTRSLFVYNKVAKTPIEYPRCNSKIIKHRL